MEHFVGGVTVGRTSQCSEDSTSIPEELDIFVFDDIF